MEGSGMETYDGSLSASADEGNLFAVGDDTLSAAGTARTARTSAGGFKLRRGRVDKEGFALCSWGCGKGRRDVHPVTHQRLEFDERGC